MPGIRGDNPPSEALIQSLLETITPGNLLLRVESLPGSYSNFTHLIVSRDPSGVETRLVVRRYAAFGSCDRGEKARREYRMLELLQDSAVPVPEPIYLDDTGNDLGSPGIVTWYVHREHISEPADLGAWARKLALTLAEIHAVPCDEATCAFLLDANREATWFLRDAKPPEYMQANPHGPAVWQLLRERWSDLEPISPTLVHIDYWPGNILWQGGQISAVLDWEEAAYGDPGIDVAYCRMELVLSGFGSVADIFLGAYEEATGRPLRNLRFWELAAAVRPMFAPEGWIDKSPSRDRFGAFVVDRMGTYQALD